MLKKYLFFIFFAMSGLCSGCARDPLSAQTNYLLREQLASFHVGSPDPMLYYPLVGQRLLVQWDLPPAYRDYPDLTLRITIRFGNREQSVRTASISDLKGHYVFILRGEEYCEKEGILTYKAEVLGNDQVLETWRHQLWVELISTTDSCDQSESLL